MWAFVALSARAQSLELEVSGLKDGGTVRAGLYASPDAWLTEEKAVATCAGKVEGGKASCALPAPGPGRYAVAFFHDLDDDGAFDKSALGLPREGWGFSRDAPTGLTGPAFSDAALQVGSGAVRVLAKVRYSLTGGG